MAGWLADPNLGALSRAEARALRFHVSPAVERLAALEFFNTAEYARVSWVAFETPPQGAAESAALAGAPSASAGAVGALLTTIRANGAALSSATTAGALSSTVGLAVTAVAQSAISAAITTIISALGASSSATTASGSLAAEVARVLWLRFETPQPSAASAQLAGAPAAQSNVTGALQSEVARVLWLRLETPQPESASAQLAGAPAAQASVTGTLTSSVLGSITAGWGAVSGAVGYRLKAGTASGVYTVTADVGNVLLGAIGGLTTGVTWYVTVVALDSGGNEGAPATEISGLPDVPGAPLNCTGAIISAAVATASLGTQILPAGTAQAMVSVAGALHAAGAALSGAAAGQATPSAYITTGISVAGQSSAVVTVSGAIGVASAALDGFAAANASAFGDLSSAGIVLDGHAEASASVAGQLSSASSALSAYAQAAASAAANLSTTIAIGGSAASSATPHGSIGQDANVIVLAARRHRSSSIEQRSARRSPSVQRARRA